MSCPVDLRQPRLIAVVIATLACMLSIQMACVSAEQDTALKETEEQDTDEPGTAASKEVNQEQQFESLNTEQRTRFEQALKAFPAFQDSDAGAVDRYSKRGDLFMFLGEFTKAEADYLKMVELDPSQDASHWRLGIAMYFAGHPEQAAAQFDKYHSFDNVDRENGIWRYLSHRKAFGVAKAKEQLLRYEKDDRPPFKEVYRLFDGSMSSQDVLDAISPKLGESEKNPRLFYSHLYIGLNESAEGNRSAAMESLRTATLNPWPAKAGYGPNYMWHVGRLEYLRLQTNQTKPAAK